jgi:uncharacterized protein YjbK
MSNFEKEVELKYDISELHFEKLLRLLKPSRSLVLENYFFSVGGEDLGHDGKVLRLRTTEDDGSTALKAEVTLKIRQSSSDGVQVCEEYNFPMSAEDLSRFESPFINANELRDLVPFSEKIGKGFIHYLGSMRTNRTIIQCEGLTLELDQCFYFGESHCEIECECSDVESTKKKLSKLFSDLDVMVTPSTTPKSARFSRAQSAHLPQRF